MNVKEFREEGHVIGPEGLICRAYDLPNPRDVRTFTVITEISESGDLFTDDMGVSWDCIDLIRPEEISTKPRAKM